MDKDFLNTISVEKFAAFLDGNLLPDEMQQMSSIVENNEMMHNIYAVSELSDETLANYTDDDLILPKEITSSDFELPSLYGDLQTPEQPAEFDVAACAACADVADEIEVGDEVTLEDVGTLDDLPSFEDSTNQIQDEINLSSPEEDGGILSDPNDF